MNDAAARAAADDFNERMAELVGSAYDTIAASVDAEKALGQMPALLRARDELREIAKSLESAHRDWHLQYKRAGYDEDPDAPPRPLNMPWLQG